MYRVEKIRCTNEEETHADDEQTQEEEDWEGCCEDVLMDDEFYEREYCD
jgi:hypothetical protein